MTALKKAVMDAPKTSGVYLMKDVAGNVIYIGKAKNLKNRLTSYLKQQEKRYHIPFLLKKIVSVEFISTLNEKEALILEENLIKKYKPKYNIQLKDDKRYMCLMLDLNHEFPKFELIRKPVKGDNVLLWGPYPSSKIIREIIATVHRLFPLRKCSDRIFLKRKKACLYYDMGQCKAPCIEKISRKEYRKLVEGAVEVINGNSKKVSSLLKKLMLEAAEKRDFEKAAFYRDVIQKKIGLFETMGVVSHKHNNIDIIGSSLLDDKTNICLLFMRHGRVLHKKEYTVQSSFSLEDTLSHFIMEYYKEGVVPPEEIITEMPIPDKDALEALLSERFKKKIKISVASDEDTLRLVKTASLNATTYKKTGSEAIDLLQSYLNLDKRPERIECFDVAHMMGMEPCCAMTVMINGELSKSDYRLFNFKETSFDDYKTLYNTLIRRFRHREWPFPHILLIDGGKGHLAIAKKVIDEMNISEVFPIAITKDENYSLYLSGRKNPLILNKGDEALKLLSLLREEAHRFANYQLKKRLKKSIL